MTERRPKRQSLILGVLIVVMVAVYARALGPRAVPTPAPTDPGGETPSVSDDPADPLPDAVDLIALPSPEQAGVRQAQRERAAQQTWSRDPFSRSSEGGVSIGLHLSGILWDATAPIAIINGQMLHVGEELDGYQILEIRQDRVSVSDGLETFQLIIAP